MTTTPRSTTRPTEALTPLRFPEEQAQREPAMSDAANDALRAMEQASRRIDDLARALNCLGFFDDDDDDRPRAA